MNPLPFPPGTPYHRLGRTDRHRWWGPLAATAAVVAGTVGLGSLLIGASRLVRLLAVRRVGPDDQPMVGALLDTATLLLVIGAALPVVLIVARFGQRRPAGTLSSVEGRLRWRWLGRCALVAIPAIWLMAEGGGWLLGLTGDAVGREATDERWVGWLTFVASLGPLLLLVPLQAAAEEYVFRGWLLQAVGAHTRWAWLAITPQAVLFAMVHGWGTPWGFVNLIAMGIVGGWLTVQTGGLEAAVALHVVNNLVAFGGGAALGLLDSDRTVADAPWQTSVVNLVVMAGYALVVRWLARRRGVPAVVVRAQSGPGPGTGDGVAPG